MDWVRMEMERRAWKQLLSHLGTPYPTFTSYPQAPFAGWLSDVGAMTSSLQTKFSIPPTGNQGGFGRDGGNQAPNLNSGPPPAPYIPLTLATARAPTTALPNIRSQPVQGSVNREAAHAQSHLFNHWPILTSTGTNQYAVTLPKGILAYINGPSSHPHEQLEAVEKEFRMQHPTRKYLFTKHILSLGPAKNPRRSSRCRRAILCSISATISSRGHCRA
ncbi:hypothetical protein WAI453_011882 [Rhynchosporium graminicola]